MNEASLQDQHGGGVDALARELGVRSGDILDLSTNTFALCSGITKTLLADIGHNPCAYPDPLALKFCSAVARHEGVREGQVLAGNGAAELIWLSFAALAPKRVVMLGPMFSEYARACTAMNIHYDIITPKQTAFAPDANTLRALRSDVAEMAVICLPNNPGTGNYAACLDALLAALEGKTVLLDLSYREFLYGSPLYRRTSREALEQRLADTTRLVTLHSVTKFFCCPGIRLGYALADEAIIQSLRRQQPPWMVWDQAALAGTRFMEHIDAYRARLPELRENVVSLAARLGKSGLFQSNHIFQGPSFVTARLVEKGSAPIVRDRLARKGILVRNCDTIPGMPPGYLRIQPRQDEQLHMLYAALTRLA